LPSYEGLPLAFLPRDEKMAGFTGSHDDHVGAAARKWAVQALITPPPQITTRMVSPLMSAQAPTRSSNSRRET
jgi:hypothetical protein